MGEGKTTALAGGGRERGWGKVKLLHSLRVELRTSRLLNGCSNQLSYDCAELGKMTVMVN